MDVKLENTPLCGRIRAISAKSDVHRFLIAAALSDGLSSLSFTTLSADIAATLGAIKALGAAIDLSGSDGEYTAKIQGIRKAQSGCVIDACECGTTARLCLPVAAALTDGFTLSGKAGLAARPFADLVAAMHCGGATADSDRLPIRVRGRLRGGDYQIRGDVSSQYISGLLFALPLCEGDSRIRLTSPLVSAGYVDMTLDTLARFGVCIKQEKDGYFVPGGQRYTAVSHYTAEGDWSGASFWLSAGALGGDVCVYGLDPASRQRDREILTYLRAAGAAVEVDGDAVRVRGGRLRATTVDGHDIPDALPVLAALLACADGTSVITGGARLKFKESDRLQTTVDLLRALGADADATGDGFILRGRQSLAGGDCSAANDHRIAMSAAVLACRTQSGITIRGAEAVDKSYPTFFHDYQKLGGKCHVITNG